MQKSKNSISVFIFASVLSLQSVMAADQSHYFEEGKSIASGQVSKGFGQIKAEKAQEIMPKYGTEPPESGFFQGGMGNLGTPGVAKVSNCRDLPADPDPIKAQECQAVNLLARNAEIRPQFNIAKTDPVFNASKNAKTNAQDVFASLGLSNSSSSNACVTKDVAVPATYESESCSIAKEFEAQQCTMGRVIDIDADSNFQCEKTVTSLTSKTRDTSVSTSSCTYGRNVNIDTDTNFQCDQTVNAYENLKCRKTVTPILQYQKNCTNGVTYTALGIRDGYVSIDEVTLDYVCNSDRETGPITIKAYAHGAQGACVGPQNLSVDFTSASNYINGPSLSPHWQGYCQPMKTKYRVVRACTASDPDCEIEMFWWQESCYYPDDISGSMVCQTYRSATINLRFQHPSQWVPSFTSVNNCSALEERSR